MSLTRRGFLGNILGGMAAVAVAPSLIKSIVASEPAVMALPEIASVAPIGCGCGIPLAYPIAICGGSFDRRYLKPYPAAVYDAEYGSENSRTIFFRRGIDNTFALKCEKKQWFRDTNLWQSGMLDYPREFIVREIGIFTDKPVNRNAVVSMSYFHHEDGTWVCVSPPNVPVVFERSLRHFPRDMRSVSMERLSQRCKIRPESQNPWMVEDNNLDSSFCVKLKQPIRMRGGEPFEVKIDWTEPPTEDTRIMVALNGEMWCPQPAPLLDNLEFTDAFMFTPPPTSIRQKHEHKKVLCAYKESLNANRVSRCNGRRSQNSSRKRLGTKAVVKNLQQPTHAKSVQRIPVHW